ncbi:DUF4344 domain-containing metallopeptidase [Devosia sp.]|uniref:DUF4344 domain-containing metallopeptidase n=1 Tax=Devosia sp. TaxID=1871048 RepID=UPI003265EA4C
MRLVLTVVAMALALTGMAEAAPLSKRQRAEANKFAANNSLFVLYHEVGHLLIDQMSLPVLGREEDAADNMATWTLLNKGTPEADAALEDAAYGWVLSGIAYNSGGDESDFYAAHSLDRQRAYQIVCLMVGADDTKFKKAADEYKLDEDRQDTCHDDYRTVNRSLKGLFDSRVSKIKGPSQVTVTYHDVSGDLQKAASAFRASGVFDQVAEELRQNYHLRRPIAFNAKRCGEANAFYDPDTIEIIYCYELMDDFVTLYNEDGLGNVAHPGQRHGGPGQQ